MTSTASSNEYRLTATDLGKVYQTGSQEIVALREMNVSVREGELFCLLGPSGCGKSTFLRIVGDLTEHTEGDFEIREKSDDQPLTSMVFQEYGIFPWKTVIDNVSFGLKIRGISKQERYEISQEYIDKVNLSGFEDTYPHQLSGGMKQRVGVARAFANDPEILLMDEPFGALDAQTKEILQEELLLIWNETKKTAVYVTHDIEEALMLGDRLGVMTARPGRIKEEIVVDLERPRSREVQSSPRFNELRNEVWDVLGEEVMRSMDQSAS